MNQDESQAVVQHEETVDKYDFLCFPFCLMLPYVIVSFNDVGIIWPVKMYLASKMVGSN